MSKFVAPGKWDPILRIAAKTWTKFVGVIMIAVGMGIGLLLTKIVLLDTDREIGMWSIVLVAVPSMVPLVFGSMMALPDIFTPFVYRFLSWKRNGGNGGNGGGPTE